MQHSQYFKFESLFGIKRKGSAQTEDSQEEVALTSSDFEDDYQNDVVFDEECDSEVPICQEIKHDMESVVVIKDEVHQNIEEVKHLDYKFAGHHEDIAELPESPGMLNLDEADFEVDSPSLLMSEPSDDVEFSSRNMYHSLLNERMQYQNM